LWMHSTESQPRLWGSSSHLRAFRSISIWHKSFYCFRTQIIEASSSKCLRISQWIYLIWIIDWFLLPSALGGWVGAGVLKGDLTRHLFHLSRFRAKTR
jgi:hypothetical protein